MIIIMKVESTKKDIDHVLESIEKVGLKGVLLQGTNRNVIAVIGDERIVPADFWDVLPGVEKTVPILAPYKLASKEGKDFKTIIHLSNGKKIGGDHIAVIAGPCAIESKEQIVEIAKRVRDAGATALRGGAFKPRSNPYTFQGLQEEGLVHLARAREASGLPIVTEVLTPEHVKLVSKYSDILQVGTRNMQNFLLLRAVGEAGKPVILKRGMSATIEEFLLAAEYILAQNNPNVILCERG
ncbi:MAG: aroA 1, partial [Candidatus Brocadiaceae bacterium]|nr:aroA 1 [Candidatus Brocadiaceae bacterium]